MTYSEFLESKNICLSRSRSVVGHTSYIVKLSYYWGFGFFSLP